MKKKILIVLTILSLSACASRQTINPVNEQIDNKICVIENPDVRHNFLRSYKQALSDKGFDVDQKPASSSTKVCDVSSTYSARWSWDLALYMIEAQIRIYKEGALVGEANYDSRMSGINPDKFINADEKIRELVTKLFPAGPKPTE